MTFFPAHVLRDASAQRSLYRRHPDNLVQAIDWLDGQGVRELATYKKGHTAQLLAGKIADGRLCAVRIPYKEDIEKDGHVRSDLLTVMGPLASQALPLGSAEILPLMPIISFCDGSQPPHVALPGVRILRSIFDMAGIKVDRFDDIAILPNGTPLFADPDICRPSSEDLSSVQIATRLRSATRILYPFIEEKIGWANEDGSPRQRDFFPLDYLQRPAPTAARPGAPEPV